jgi:hypothetical protein
MTEETIVVLLGLWFVCGVIASAIADECGGSAAGGFWAGFLLGPLGIAVAFFLRDPEGRQRKAAQLGELRRCPECAELIQREALTCKHCRTRLARRCDWCQRRIALPNAPCSLLSAEDIRDQWPVGDAKCQSEATTRSIP